MTYILKNVYFNKRVFALSVSYTFLEKEVTCHCVDIV